MRASLRLTSIAVLAAVLAGCGKTDAPGDAEAPGAGETEMAATQPAKAEPLMLVGTDADDTLTGGDAPDHLTGGPGADTLDGQSEFDYARYDTATQGVVVSMTDPSANTGDAAGDRFVSIEGLVGSPFDDRITGDDFVNDLHGLAGNDVIRGLGGNDVLGGEEGDDDLDGGAGEDGLDGGPGNDIFRFAAGEVENDWIAAFEGAGPGAGDVIVLKGYGAGATFTKESDTVWVAASADGKFSDRITIREGGANLDSSDYRFE